MSSFICTQYCKGLRLFNKIINMRKQEMDPAFFSRPLEISLDPDCHGEILSHVSQGLGTLCVSTILVTYFHSTRKLGLSEALQITHLNFKAMRHNF